MIGAGRRAATPVTPHPPSWGITDVRPRTILTDGLDSDWSGIHTREERNYLNGHSANDGQVDMLYIPGKGRCSVYIARYVLQSINPTDTINAYGVDSRMIPNRKPKKN